ncbi:MAG: RNA methyltransferase [Alphaproteobacteria bacterium]|nr:RNA methyltransferase [Alphaproteobacteria bacterium]
MNIRALGAQGDGISEANGETIYIPFTLPGETVTADVSNGRGQLLSVDAASPDRAPARCPHYRVCGGCNLQHLAETPYLAFKRDLVVSALASRGLSTDVDPTISVSPKTRRRATLAAAHTPAGFAFGFHGRRTHQIVAISDCAVLTPGLMRALPAIEQLSRMATPPRGKLAITATETPAGIDIAFVGAGKWFSADDRLRLVQAATETRLIRISIDGEVVLEREKPALKAGSAFLVPPPGGFLQATSPSETAMVQLVGEAVDGARKIVDLFAGSGTFTLPLAQTANLHAIESDAAALAALAQAARSTQSLRAVTTDRRDLFRQPLTVDELNRFDGAVMDPPRSGAEAQARNLAASKVRRLAMVSCNAASFARDMSLLVQGGWRIDRVSPVDQFLWSSHIEIVAALSR